MGSLITILEQERTVLRYGPTEEEVDFILNYDIQYHPGLGRAFKGEL